MVRWGAVVATFAGTIAIAVDQVGIRQKRLEKAEATVTAQEQLLKKLLRASKEAIEQASESNEKMVEFGRQLKLVVDAAEERQKLEAIAKLQALQKRLEEHKAESDRKTEARATRPAAAVVSQVPYQAPQVADPELPWWRPGLRATVDRQIKAAAQVEWKDDYTMVEHEMKRQGEAYDQLLAYNRDYRPETKRIIARAVHEWGSDYVMVVHEIKRQTESLQRIK